MDRATLLEEDLGHLGLYSLQTGSCRFDSGAFDSYEPTKYRSSPVHCCSCPDVASWGGNASLGMKMTWSAFEWARFHFEISSMAECFLEARKMTENHVSEFELIQWHSVQHAHAQLRSSRQFRWMSVAGPLHHFSRSMPPRPRAQGWTCAWYAKACLETWSPKS